MQAFMSGRQSFFACRALLGLIEGGFIPDNILYLSYFYTGFELPRRLSWFWVSYQSTQIVSAFLAFGILRLRGYNGMEGWVSIADRSRATLSDGHIALAVRS
jgi:MFS family permease